MPSRRTTRADCVFKPALLAYRGDAGGRADELFADHSGDDAAGDRRAPVRGHPENLSPALSSGLMRMVDESAITMYRTLSGWPPPYTTAIARLPRRPPARLRWGGATLECRGGLEPRQLTLEGSPGPSVRWPTILRPRISVGCRVFRSFAARAMIVAAHSVVQSMNGCSASDLPRRPWSGCEVRWICDLDRERPASICRAAPRWLARSWTIDDWRLEGTQPC